MIKNTELFLCTPESYQSMTSFIDSECEHENNGWIYNIIKNGACAPYSLDEEIILETFFAFDLDFDFLRADLDFLRTFLFAVLREPMQEVFLGILYYNQYFN